MHMHANDRLERKPSRSLLLFGLVLAGSLTAASTVSAESWGCLGNLFGGDDNTTTTYAPPYVPAPTSVAQGSSTLPTRTFANYSCALPVTQTTVYKPEVDYRWTYSRIKRTEYEPVTAVDPCTGCTTTYYRPEEKKSLLPWLHREKVVRYKPTKVNMVNACYTPSCTVGCPPVANACGTCSTPIGSASTIGSGCTSCGVASAPVSSTINGTTTVVSPSATGTTITPTPDPASTTPSLQGMNTAEGTSASGPYRSNRPTTEDAGKTEQEIHPAPSSETEETLSEETSSETTDSRREYRVRPIPDTQHGTNPPLYQPERKTTDVGKSSLYQTAVYRQPEQSRAVTKPVAHASASSMNRQQELARRAAEQKHLWHAPAEKR